MAEEIGLKPLETGGDVDSREKVRTCGERACGIIADNFIFDKDQKKLYYERYTCIPDCKNHVGGPPIFILTLILMQLSFFIYYAVTSHEVTWTTLSSSANASPFIFSPYRREEVWRFLTYMFLHAGLGHLFSNFFIQLCFGIPLELVHGSLRVMEIYLIGVIAGSLGSSVFDVGAYLVGASGGGSALLFAYLANIVLNWYSMNRVFGVMRIILVSLFILADFGLALHRRFGLSESGRTVSHAAHLGGGLAGLLIGFVLLKNFKIEKWEDILTKASVGVFVVFILVAILFNIFCPCYDPYE